jgi:hypothetical protein
MGTIERRLLDFYAQEPHFIDHFAPIWAVLGLEERGSFFVPGRLLDHAKKRGVDATAWNGKFEGRSVLCFNSSGLLRLFTRLQGNRPIAFFEHGAGFTFGGLHSSYAGSPHGRKAVSLFCNPNKYAQRANQRTFPKTRQAIIGCPKMDRWHNRPPKPMESDPVIAISFHWDCLVVPETRGGFGWYAKALPELAKRHRLIGHGHPRIWKRVEGEYIRLGIEPVQDFEEVLERADLYINDCSSTLYEFASTGRPVVVLNLPTYRRNRKIGLRFWEHSDVGVNCNHPESLCAAVDAALLDPMEQRVKRESASRDVFPMRGHAAGAAAAAIRSLCND